MIKLESIKKSFRDKSVFENVSFVLNPGEKVGLVGKNGSGKTTLLKIIVGKIEPDEGSIIIDKNERIGYLAQTVEPDFEKTIKEFFSDNQKIQDWQIKKFLSRLGIQNINLKRKLKSFSGGETTRIALAKVLLQDPTILLLDEPTNHLDIEGLTYLQRFLSSYQGGVLLVSHDRWILDKVLKKIIELQLTEKGRTAKIYAGNFTAYQETQKKEKERQERLYGLQQKRFKAIKEDIEKTKQYALKTEKGTTHDYYRTRAKKVAKKAKAREKKLEKLIESEERIGKPQKEKLLRFEFTNYLARGQRVIQGKNLCFGFKKKSLFKKANIELYGKDKAVLMGPNGSGKTTLLEVLLSKRKAHKGEVKLSPSVKIGYLPQKINFKDQEKTVLEEFEKGIEIEQSEGRRLLGKFLFSGQEQIKKIKNLSIGERRKLYLAKIVASGANFLVLDEPTNHLDIASIEAVEKALSLFKGAILVISHDRYFLKNIGVKKFYYLKEGRFQELTSLEDVVKVIRLSPN